MDDSKKLTVIRLLNPQMCEDCRFASLIIATRNDGVQEEMIRCKRLDCDNWITAGINREN